VKKMELYNKRLIIHKKKYREQQLKDQPKLRSNSFSQLVRPTWDNDLMDFVDIDITIAVAKSYMPFSEDFIPCKLPEEEKIFTDILVPRW
jgi:hypothetical protein